MSLNSALLTTTISNIFVSTGTTAVTTLYITNYSTTSNVTFSLYAVTSGGSPSNTNKIYSNVFVTAGDTYIIDSERLILDNNESLRASTNANSICSATLSYTTI